MNTLRLIAIGALAFLSSALCNAQDRQLSALEKSMEEIGLVDISKLDNTILIDLKYATTDNFTGVVLYDSMRYAYLHPLAAEKLVKAQENLKKIDPNLTLLVYDAARPLSIQQIMFDKVKNTRHQSYVANPSKRGLHNFGIAVDLTISDLEGNALDMGTPFDYFGRAAAIRDEEGLVKEGVLNRNQVNNRKLLRKIMLDAGFLSILGEWWHFNAISLSQAKKECKLIE